VAKKIIGLPVLDWSKVGIRDLREALKRDYCFIPKPGLDESQIPDNLDPEFRSDLYFKHYLTSVDRRKIRSILSPKS